MTILRMNLQHRKKTCWKMCLSSACISSKIQNEIPQHLISNMYTAFLCVFIWYILPIESKGRARGRENAEANAARLMINKTVGLWLRQRLNSDWLTAIRRLSVNWTEVLYIVTLSIRLLVLVSKWASLLQRSKNRKLKPQHLFLKVIKPRKASYTLAIVY